MVGFSRMQIFGYVRAVLFYLKIVIASMSFNWNNAEGHLYFCFDACSKQILGEF